MTRDSSPETWNEGNILCSALPFNIHIDVKHWILPYRPKIRVKGQAPHFAWQWLWIWYRTGWYFEKQALHALGAIVKKERTKDEKFIPWEFANRGSKINHKGTWHCLCHKMFHYLQNHHRGHHNNIHCEWPVIGFLTESVAPRNPTGSLLESRWREAASYFVVMGFNLDD